VEAVATGAGEDVLHGHLPWLVQGLEWIAAGIDLFAILLLLVGTARFALGVAQTELSREEVVRLRGMNRERIELGRYILAGLELLIVSDIIHTALSLQLEDLLYLGFLVVIRSVISIFLERELDGLRREMAEPREHSPHSRAGEGADS
jgi:uncharacterized membrane protein